MSTPTRTVALMLESDGPGGAEVVVFQLAEELRRRGHRVVPVGPARGVGWLGAKFRDAGFDPETFTLRRPLDWRCLRDMTAMLRRRGVDAVHSHEFTMSVYGTAAARKLGVPHVITMHGNQKMTRALRRRVALRWAFRNSHATVAVSAETKRTLDHDLGLRADTVSVIRNGVPVRPGSPDAVRRELGLCDHLVLLAVGNLDPRKGHIILLRALDQLEQEGLQVPWQVVIAGGRGGPEHEGLLAFARERGFGDRLHILLNRSDIPDLQAAADIFVMPSLWEGLPLAVLEAMHAGNPIVASETSGIPEAIVSEQHGLLIPPGDVGKLAKALRRVLVDPALRARLGAAAKQRATAEFTIGAMTDGYERLYRAESTSS